MPTLIGIKEGPDSASISYVDKRYVRRYERTYLVETDNSTQDALSAAQTLGLPSIGSTWTSGVDFDLGARLISIEPSRIPGTRIWELLFSWDSTTKQDDEQAEKPEDRTPEWDWSYETIQQQLLSDKLDGKPIENSAFEPIFLDTDVPISILTITRFKETFDRNEIFDYVGKVNSMPFWDAAPRTVLMAGITDRRSDTRATDGTEYRLVTYTLKFHPDPDGWILKVLDQGTKYFENFVEKTFVDDNQNPTVGKLDGNGGALADGANDVYLEFSPHDEADFTALDLGPW